MTLENFHSFILFNGLKVELFLYGFKVKFKLQPFYRLFLGRINKVDKDYNFQNKSANEIYIQIYNVSFQLLGLNQFKGNKNYI